MDLSRGQTDFARLRPSNDCLTLSRLVATHPPTSYAHLAAHHIHQHNSVNTHREHTPLTPRSSPCPTQHIDATYIYLIITSHRATVLCVRLLLSLIDSSLTRSRSCPSLLTASHKTYPAHARLTRDDHIQFIQLTHASVMWWAACNGEEGSADSSACGTCNCL